MTTLVADLKRRILVADSLVTTDNDLPQYTTDKLYRAGKSIFGERGDVNPGLRFRRWQLDGATKKDRPKFTDKDDFTILEMCPDGLFMWDATMARERVKNEIYAVGSGAKIALYCALILKYPVERCVLEASKVDIHTAPPIQRIELDGTEGPIVVDVL